MFLRQVGSPRPVPSGRVVKKGWKICFCTPSGIPPPSSATWNPIDASALSYQIDTQVRLAIAAVELSSRLTSTASSWLSSPVNPGSAVGGVERYGGTAFLGRLPEHRHDAMRQLRQVDGRMEGRSGLRIRQQVPHRPVDPV